MLGQEISLLLRQHGHEVIALGRDELDVTNSAAVRERIGRLRPGVVVNCAAWTAVDAAEDEEAQALLVNGTAVAHLASACLPCGARLVQVSTDYVFGAREQQSYSEDDKPAPLNAYGRTKLAGEAAVLRMPSGGYVVRTAWLYGAYGRNFARTMIGQARTGSAVRVVNDQRGQPTWTLDVADRIIALTQAGAPPGIYHATSSGAATWYEFAREIYRLTGTDPDLVSPVTSDAYPRPAARPRCAVLGHDAWTRAGLAPIGNWADSLVLALPGLLAS
jgi:dTDP-4-dehydrorhamnose reductase